MHVWLQVCGLPPVACCSLNRHVIPLPALRELNWWALSSFRHGIANMHGTLGLLRLSATSHADLIYQSSPWLKCVAGARQLLARSGSNSILDSDNRIDCRRQ